MEILIRIKLTIQNTATQGQVSTQKYIKILHKLETLRTIFQRGNIKLYMTIHLQYITIFIQIRQNSTIKLKTKQKQSHSKPRTTQL